MIGPCNKEDISGFPRAFYIIWYFYKRGRRYSFIRSTLKIWRKITELFVKFSRKMFDACTTIIGANIYELVGKIISIADLDYWGNFLSRSLLSTALYRPMLTPKIFMLLIKFSLLLKDWNCKTLLVVLPTDLLVFEFGNKVYSLILSLLVRYYYLIWMFTEESTVLFCVRIVGLRGSYLWGWSR